MHFSVEQAPLLLQIQRCQNVVDRKKIDQVLGHILLRIEDDQLLLAASDGQMYLSTQLAVEVKEAGSVIVPAKKLFEVIRELQSNQRVEFHLDGSVLKLKSGLSRFRLNTLGSEAFPDPPEERVEEHFDIPPLGLIKMIHSVIFCISSDDSRKFLTGASFVYNKETQRLCSRTSNGFHMALAELYLNTTSNLTECLIPQRTLIEIRRLCEDATATVTLAMGPHQVCFRSNNVTLYSKVIEDTFPPYDHLISSELPNMIELNKSSFEQVLRRCLLVSNDLTYDICMSLTSKGIEVSAHNMNQESAEEQINADVVLGDDLEQPYKIGVNGMFLREVLSALPGEFVQIHFLNAESALMVVDRDDEMARYIIMPLQIEG